MVKDKKRHNWKARDIVEVTSDNSFSKKVRVEVDNRHSYDQANAYVLPSKKRKTVVIRNKTETVKLLSKKKKKLLEKIIQRKKNKQDRAALIKALTGVQASPALLSKLTSFSEIQTKGIKRLYENSNEIPDEIKLSDTKKIKLKCGKLNEKIKIKNLLEINDPNVVGFDLSSDSENESDNSDNNLASNNEEIIVPIISENKTVPENNPENLPSQLNSASDNSDNNLTSNNEEIIAPIISENEAALENKPENLPFKSESDSAKKVFVSVNRLPEIQRARLKLPIIGEEQVIMEAIHENDVVIIGGETGSGKTTQLPQFLYEAGYSLNSKMIGITEPRRVAAISMSRRVAEELNLSSEEVSYLIRFEGNVGSNTQIKFMTDGVLLKEMQTDFLLSKYSAIVLDEAHERSIYTDILIGLLSRIAPLRRKRNNPLKLIVMSATLRMSDFTDNSKLFKVPPPVIKVDSRQFPVTIHFNKKTAVDYLQEAFRKTCKIHTQLPEGGILVFVTGQQEVNMLVSKLRKTFPFQRQRNQERTTKSKNEIKRENVSDNIENENVYCGDSDDDEVESKKFRQKLRKMKKNVLPNIKLEDYAIKPTDEEMEMFESDDDDDELDDGFANETFSAGNKFQPMWALPLYSFLPSRIQAKVFEPPPEGCRLCVVATNVAETSLTIPHVKYVVDCGRTKTRFYDKLTAVSAFRVTWTSKASADQRAGRAGRTGPGHCYRLYSSAVFNDQFEKWSVPEIRRKPIDNLLLQMKSLKIDRVVNFPFPSAPDVEQLKAAEKRLTLLGALTPSSNFKDEWSSKLTPLGESMSAFPVAPRFAKMLCLSQQYDLLSYTVVIVAALSVQEFLLMPNDNFYKIWRSWAGVGNSLSLGDVMLLLRALGAAEYASTSKEGVENFCSRCGLRYKAVVEARKLRVQLTNELNLNVNNLNLAVDPTLSPPTDSQARQLRQIIMSGMVDQVAYRLSENELKEAGLSIHKAAYRMPQIEDIIYINSSSVLRKLKPEWMVYQEVYQHNDKVYARGITAIEPEWLPLYAAPLCNITDPLKEPPPCYEDSSGRVMCYVSSTFGRSGWQLPVVQIEFPYGEDRFKWFAKFFLVGVVCSQLEPYATHLLSSPETIFKSWAKFLLNRTNVILKYLIDKDVDCKEKLLREWKSDPKYLLSAYLEWLPKSAHNEIKSFWPPTR